MKIEQEDRREQEIIDRQEKIEDDRLENQHQKETKEEEDLSLLYDQVMSKEEVLQEIIQYFNKKSSDSYQKIKDCIISMSV
jgi:hypothetical protein